MVNKLALAIALEVRDLWPLRYKSVLDDAVKRKDWRLISETAVNYVSCESSSWAMRALSAAISGSLAMGIRASKMLTIERTAELARKAFIEHQREENIRLMCEQDKQAIRLVKDRDDVVKELMKSGKTKREALLIVQSS